MYTIVGSFPDEIYYMGWFDLQKEGRVEDSRAGQVLVMPDPVTTVYLEPYRRVLFSPQRDANPFFHVAEIVWMMGGSNDGTWLDRFVHDFSSRYAEEDGKIHGAYGHRWRAHFEADQIKAVVRMFQKDPNTRRAVIAMWSPDDDLEADKRDLPCNTHIYFANRNGRLDMTVCCRSNDMIWGAYGANLVHMSALHELIATELGLQIGRYFQVSNNFHAYTNIFNKKIPDSDRLRQDYLNTEERPTPLVSPGGLGLFLRECSYIVQGARIIPESRWLVETALPLFAAHGLFKEGNLRDALDFLRGRTTMSWDWQRAAIEWIERRYREGD